MPFLRYFHSKKRVELLYVAPLKFPRESLCISVYNNFMKWAVVKVLNRHAKIINIFSGGLLDIELSEIGLRTLEILSKVSARNMDVIDAVKKYVLDEIDEEKLISMLTPYAIAHELSK